MLKQSPRAWFHRLRDFLLKIGFNEGILDTSLFIDDIVITSSSVRKIKSTIAQLGDEFSFKDLGNLNYFLGIHVCRSEHGFISISAAVHG